MRGWPRLGAALLLSVLIGFASLAFDVEILADDPIVVGREADFFADATPSPAFPVFDWAIDGVWGYGGGDDYWHHTFPNTGNYEITVMVCDFGGGCETETLTIDVLTWSAFRRQGWDSALGSVIERRRGGDTGELGLRISNAFCSGCDSKERLLRKATKGFLHGSVPAMYLDGTKYYVYRLSNEYLNELKRAGLLSANFDTWAHCSWCEQVFFVNRRTGLPELNPSKVRQLAMLLRSEIELQSEFNAKYWREGMSLASRGRLIHHLQTGLWKGAQLGSGFAVALSGGATALVAAFKTGVGALLDEILESSMTLNDIARSMTMQGLASTYAGCAAAIGLHNKGGAPRDLGRVEAASQATLWRGAFTNLTRADKAVWSPPVISRDVLADVTIGTVKRLLASAAGGLVGSSASGEFTASLAAKAGLKLAQEWIESKDGERLQAVMEDLEEAAELASIPEVSAMKEYTEAALTALALSRIYVEIGDDLQDVATDLPSHIGTGQVLLPMGASYQEEAAQARSIASAFEALADSMISELEAWVSKVLPPDPGSVPHGFEAAALEIAMELAPADLQGQ